MLGGTEELQLQRRLLSNDGLRFVLRFQSLFQNALDAVDIYQVEVESPPASRVQTSGAVAFGQAQQLLRPAQDRGHVLRTEVPHRPASCAAAAAMECERAVLVSGHTTKPETARPISRSAPSFQSQYCLKSTGERRNIVKR